MSDTPRLAVLIDADNTSHRHAGALLEEVARYGVPTVKRAYGDWTTPRLNGWKDELNRNAISPVQQFAYTTGKNSTDSALIIDAMDLLYTGNLDAFAIVSSDSDFTRLVTRLRESGRTVYGLGRRRTPQSLVAACDKFIYLEVLGRGEGRAKDADPARGGRGPGGADETGGDEVDEVEESDEDVPELPQLEPLLRSAIDATSDDDGWSHLGAVGSFLNTRHASFDPRNYGFSKLIALARAQDSLEVRQDGGSAPMVRLSTGSPAGSATSGSGTAAKKTPRKRAPRKKAAAAPAEPAAEQQPAEPEQPAAVEPTEPEQPSGPRVTTRTRGSRSQPSG